MRSLTVWNIHTDGGRYLGQAASIHPKTALCEYLFISTDVSPSLYEIRGDNTAGDACRLTYNGEVFVLTPQD